jgi:hypothetical protein
VGQTRKVGARNRHVRFPPVIAGGPFRAKLRHPPTPPCAILGELIGGMYLATEPQLGQRNCTQA